MREFLKDGEHLIRMGALFLAGLTVFLVVRSFLVPEDYYELGHFRTGAIADNMTHPIMYAGREACAACHSDVVQGQEASRHAGIGCEACHGPLARHAEDPGGLHPARLDARKLCLTCHQRDSAKPKSFRQIIPQEHMGAAPCLACHRPHHPEMA